MDKMNWYNWVGVIGFTINIMGLNGWLWEKMGYKITPADISIISGVCLILLVINR